MPPLFSVASLRRFGQLSMCAEAVGRGEGRPRYGRYKGARLCCGRSRLCFHDPQFPSRGSSRGGFFVPGLCSCVNWTSPLDSGPSSV